MSLDRFMKAIDYFLCFMIGISLPAIILAFSLPPKYLKGGVIPLLAGVVFKILINIVKKGLSLKDSLSAIILGVLFSALCIALLIALGIVLVCISVSVHP
jgi:hypothetical protein